MSQFDSIRFQPSRPLLKEVSADRLNAILAEIKKNRPRGERGITVRQSGDATYIGLAASIKGGGAAPEPRPWDIYVVDSDDDTYTVKVRPGTIADILPSNWDDEFPCDKDTLYYGKVIVTTDGKNVTSATIAIDTDEPEQQETLEFAVDSPVQFLFGLFENEGFRIVTVGNISAYPSLQITTSKSPAAAPGESPYVLWYRLA